MSQPTLDFDRDAFYKLLSAFQNRIRDGKVPEAMAIGYDIWRMNPGAFWNRAVTIAVEDAPDALVAVDTLKRWYESLSKDGQTNEGQMGVMRASQLLAEAQKDRMADELLHIEKAHNDYRPAAEYLSKLQRWEDKDITPHMSRGYKYFVEVKSDTKNQKPSYREWRKFWVELMRRGTAVAE
jgi:hypothetical protein